MPVINEERTNKGTIEVNSNLHAPKTFLKTVNKDSSLRRPRSPKSKHVDYWYVILPGNNSDLIRRCMQQRLNWKECANKETNLFNLKWKESSKGVDFSVLTKNNANRQLVNHFEYHREVSNKLNLYINLMKYCEVSDLLLIKIIGK